MKRFASTCFQLVFPPFLFVPVGIAFAPDGTLDASRVPWILLVTQILLALWILFLIRRGKFTAPQLGLDASRFRATLIVGGLLVGAMLAGLYEVAIGPALDWLRANVGDVIPPGETRRALGAAIVPFAIANIAFAPFVEEVLYRGILERRLREWWGPRVAAMFGVLGFGLLHWAGGVFYIAATAVIGAGLLAARRFSDSLYTSIAAHLGFNVCEVALTLFAGSAT